MAYLPFFYSKGVNMYDGEAMRYGKKARYPVNMLHMSRTDTTDYMGEREAVGYGAGNSDPHQSGFMGEMASNMEEKKPVKYRKNQYGHGLGVRN